MTVLSHRATTSAWTETTTPPTRPQARDAVLRTAVPVAPAVLPTPLTLAEAPRLAEVWPEAPAWPPLSEAVSDVELLPFQDSPALTVAVSHAVPLASVVVVAALLCKPLAAALVVADVLTLALPAPESDPWPCR